MSEALVTDPNLLAQLNGAPDGLQPVEDPDLLAKLNAGMPSEPRRLGGIVTEGIGRGVVNMLSLPAEVYNLGAAGIRATGVANPQPFETGTNEDLTRRAQAAGMVDQPGYEPRNMRERFGSSITEGTTMGAPFGPYGMLAGALGGAGVQGARELWPGNKLAEIAGSIVGGVAGPGAVTGLGRLARALTTRGPQTELQALYAAEGMTPRTAGAGTGAAGVQSLEAKIADAPGAVGVMRRASQATIDDIDAALERRAAELGTFGSKEGAGQQLQAGARQAAARFEQRQEQLYQNAFAQINPQRIVTPNSTYAALQRLEAQAAAAPASEGPIYREAINRARALIDDATTPQGLSFEALRRIRSNLGADVAPRPLTGGLPSSENALRSLYGPITEDMYEAARQASPAAERALRTADRYTRLNRAVNTGVLDDLAGFKEAEDAFKYAMSGAKDGGSRLRAVTRQMDQPTRDEFGAVIIRNLGRSADQEGFSPARFMSEWSKLSPEAKTAAFPPATLEAVDRIARIADVARQTTTYANTSRTAGTSALLNMLGFGGGGIAGTVLGGPLAGAAGAVTPLVAANVTANLMTSPTFIRWLSTPVAAGALPAHLRALVPIAQENPAIAGEIKQFLQAVSPAANQPTGQGRR